MRNYIIKTLFILLVICLTGTSVTLAQWNTRVNGNKNGIFLGDEVVDTTNATPEQMTRVQHILGAIALSKDHYYYDFPFVRTIGIKFVNRVGTKSEIYEGPKWGSQGLFKSVLIAGNCAIEVSALGITEENAGDYIYHVVQSDKKEIVPWTKPSVFKHTSNGKFKYAYLGKFNYVPQQYLTIEVYNNKTRQNIDAFMLDWSKIEPAEFFAVLSVTNPPYNNQVYLRELTDTSIARRVGRVQIDGPNINIVPHNKTAPPNEIKFRLGDSLTKIRFQTTNKHTMYNYAVSLKSEVYGHTDTINIDDTNDYFDLRKPYWRFPGKYTVILTPKVHKHGGEPVVLLNNLASSITFTVLPDMKAESSIPAKTVAYVILIILTTGGFMFMMYRSGQKRKIAAEAQNKQIAMLQLASVRAQLNPHFIFNALAGIQNLMNKNEVENANKYLARFARLTRNVLDDGNKELVTIEHEISLLNDYLLMEQTRFGFQFNIEADENKIDQQIEIPAMLLQPFVENAVKHGVSALNGDGMITVAITQKDSTLILTVNDNGKGFGNADGAGMGIKLCEDRVKLLNSIYKNSTILLHRTSDGKGTLITIELRNWI